MTGNGTVNVLDGRSGADVLRGGGAGDTLRGGGGGDTLFGQLGADKLYGGAGKDTLWGGDAADRFVFDTALSASTNVDRIRDFNRFEDTIAIDNRFFIEAGPNGTLTEARFNLGASAEDPSDRIIYHKATGSLF